MKKTIALLLCVLTTLSLAACGGGQSAPAPTAAPTQAPAQAPAAPEATPVPAASEPTAAPAAPVSAPADDAVEKAKALVLSMKDQPVDDLLAELDKLGMQYKSRDYFSSCLVQGGQDGVLEYEGFTVYTLVQPDGAETVYDVE